MEDKEDKVNFKFKELLNNNYLNCKLKMYNNEKKKKFKITKYLGKGTVGQVFLMEEYLGKYFKKNINKKYALKISNANCSKDLYIEVRAMKNFTKLYNITHSAFPLYYGLIEDTDNMAVVYNYLGYYNLDNIKKYRSEKHICEACGKNYTKNHKLRHEKTIFHLKAQEKLSVII